MIRAFIILALLMVPGLRASLAADAPASPPPKTITQDQARLALDILNDPAKRTAFTATLNAILANQPGSQKASNAETPSKPATTSIEGVHVPLAPDSLGAQVLLSASDLVTRLGNQTVDAIDAVQSLPLLYGWIIVMATNPVAQSLLLDVTWRVAIILAAAAGAWWLLHKLLRRPIARLQRFGRLTDLGSRSASAVSLSETSSAKSRHRLSPWTLLTRVPVVFARMLLELVPVFGILLVGHIAAASSLGGQTISRLIILAVIDAAAVCAAVLSVARMLLSPGQPQLRLFHIQDATAGYLMRWLKRLTLIVVVGYLAGEVGLSLGLSSIAHNAIQKTVGLVVHVCLIIIVLRQRHAVQQWLHAPADAKDLTARVRNALALIWHWVAIFFLVAGWIVWAVELPHGYTILLHYFIITALMLIGTRLTLLLWLGGLDRAFKAQMKPEYAGIRARFRTYYPLLSGAIRVFMYTLCVLGLLQLYGLNTFLWLLTTALGLRLLSAAATLLLTIIAAFAVWEVVNGAFQKHLDRLQQEAQMARSARLRTLLPLLRTSLLITLIIVAALMILSEIGINVAPLLAGAGIVGVAIGFGSQKLVQDLITGIFLLLENAMQVGDWVTVSGLSGTVENLSVRTIRLRAGDGSVHIIPFSSVTSVTNVNRGLGNASVSVTIAYQEDTDRAARELSAIGLEMRSDPDLSAKMLSDFQLWGVDRLDGASVTIVGQIVCTDTGRWPVQREFNRRMKQRFQSLGIRVYDPSRTVVYQPGMTNPANPAIQAQKQPV